MVTGGFATGSWFPAAGDGARWISRIGTRTSGNDPCTYILRDAGNGAVVSGELMGSSAAPFEDPVVTGAWLIVAILSPKT